MIRFAIVGCGRISNKHAQAIAQTKDAKLVYCCDILPYKADFLAKEYKAKSIYNFEELLRRNDIDIVNICTPSGFHSSMAIKALERNKHVIVEKPMALKVVDARKMIATAKLKKKKLAVVLQNRFNPSMQELKRIVDEGLLGKIYLANVTVRWYRPQEYYQDGWHGTKLIDGGALMNQSIHHIDALQWLIGMPEKVFCYKDALGHNMEMEDVGVATLRFPGGTLATIEASTICWPENMEGSISLFGENGSVKVGGTALNKFEFIKIKNFDPTKSFSLSYDNPSSVYGNSYSKIISEIIAAINENRQPATNNEEGLRSLQIVTALYESAKKNKEASI